MTYPVLVLLPDAAAWSDPPYVVARGRGPVDEDLHRSYPSATTQIELAVEGEDDLLEQRLLEVGRLALEHQGVALDARSLAPLAKPAPNADTADDDDPGPVWEHLPGVGLTQPTSGSVVDAQPALEHLETAVVDPGQPTQYEPEIGEHRPGGLWVWIRAMRAVRSHSGRFIVVSVLCAAAGWSAGGVDENDMRRLLPLLVSAIAVPIALVPGGSRLRSRTINLLVGTVGAMLLITLVGLVPGIGPVTLLVSPLLFSVPAAAWSGMTPSTALHAIWRLIRQRWLSVGMTWFFLVQWPLAIFTAILLGIGSDWSFDGVQGPYGTAVVTVSTAIAFCFTTGLALVARDSYAD